MSEPLGIMGLGRVGLAAAKAYLNDGYKVFACDIDPRRVDEFTAEGGVALKTPADVAQRAKVILVLVLNDEQATDVISGDHGLVKEIGSGSTVIFMSTINAHTLRKLANACLLRKADFIDCPFTGGPGRIANRSLTLIAAGDPESLNRVKHILEVIGKIVYAGREPGKGQAVKHCNQLLVAVTHAATMEVITLARKLGLDPAMVSSVVASGIAGSDYFRLLSDSVLNKTPSPGGLGQMCKDAAIVKNTLIDHGVGAQVALAASRYFQTALDLGMSQNEGADLIQIVEKATKHGS